MQSEGEFALHYPVLIKTVMSMLKKANRESRQEGLGCKPAHALTLLSSASSDCCSSLACYRFSVSEKLQEKTNSPC